MSLFSAMDAVAAKAMTAVHADSWALEPFMPAADVKAPAVPDPSRTAMTIVAIYRDKEAPRAVPNSYDRRTDQRPGVETTICVLEVDPRVQAPGFVDVRRFDLLTGPDGQKWRVLKREPDEMGRLHAHLNLVS